MPTEIRIAVLIFTLFTGLSLYNCTPHNKNIFYPLPGLFQSRNIFEVKFTNIFTAVQCEKNYLNTLIAQLQAEFY